ncbi:MAG: hypothetical protein R3C17_13010 [Planctomycetaceae bacterium]
MFGVHEREHPRRFDSLNLTSFRRRSLSAVRARANQMPGASVGPKRRSDTQIDGAVFAGLFHLLNPVFVSLPRAQYISHHCGVSEIWFNGIGTGFGEAMLELMTNQN